MFGLTLFDSSWDPLRKRLTTPRVDYSHNELLTLLLSGVAGAVAGGVLTVTTDSGLWVFAFAAVWALIRSGVRSRAKGREQRRIAAELRLREAKKQARKQLVRHRTQEVVRRLRRG